MLLVEAKQLTEIVTSIFQAASCTSAEARCVATHLVDANLTGHDSHGVIRVLTYVQWIEEGLVLPGQHLKTVLSNGPVIVADGQCGLGQTIGEEAVDLGVSRCREHGVAVVALRNAGHLGRIGDWPWRAAQENILSLHFVNTSGKGMLVAPFGGIDRRISANPIAAGVPIEGRPPMILDISACTIAEGKIRVAFNKGEKVPDGCIIDANGQPTNDPQVFYADPPGAILPFGAHKGYGLSMIVEILAGALTGGDCTNPKNAAQLLNGMCSIYLDPEAFGDAAGFQIEVQRFVDFVRSSRPNTPGGEIYLPGQVEEITKAKRLKDGIPVDQKTWDQLSETGNRLGVSVKSG